MTDTSDGEPPNTGAPPSVETRSAVARVSPAAAHATGSSSFRSSILGLMLQLAQRKSSPNQATTRLTLSIAGSTASIMSSEASQSEARDSVCRLSASRPVTLPPEDRVT